MIFLILTILFSIGVLLTIKLFERFEVDAFQAVTFNYIISLSASLYFYTGNIPLKAIVNQDWFVFALITGLGFIFMFNVFAYSVQKIGVALSTVASKMSVIIPIYTSIILFKETLNIYKISGIILTLTAFYLIFKKEKDKPFRKIYFFLPLLLFFGNGANDTMQKYCSMVFLKDDSKVTLFMFVVFSTALIIGMTVLLFMKIFKGTKIKPVNLLAGISLGIFNFGSTYYFLRTIGVFDATFIFPVFNVSFVALSAMIGGLIFKEKLRMINWAGIVVAIIAIVIIAIG